jgi:hypothetical protein
MRLAAKKERRYDRDVERRGGRLGSVPVLARLPAGFAVLRGAAPCFFCVDWKAKRKIRAVGA